MYNVTKFLIAVVDGEPKLVRELTLNFTTLLANNETILTRKINAVIEQNLLLPQKSNNCGGPLKIAQGTVKSLYGGNFLISCVHDKFRHNQSGIKIPSALDDYYINEHNSKTPTKQQNANNTKAKATKRATSFCLYCKRNTLAK